jgi:hypothetical protein
VYAFIATPVQFWHHHKYEPGAIASHSTEANAISKSDVKTDDANCQICSHHYSVYTDDAPPVFATTGVSKVANESYSLQSVPTSPFFNLTGRGPPAL